MKLLEGDVDAEHERLGPRIVGIVVHAGTVDSRFGIDVLGVLFERRPVAEVLAREIDADLVDAGLLGEGRGDRVADGQVFQAQVADILQVTVVDLAQITSR